jgi:thiamine biosynthesis lipoprotein
MGCDMKAWLDAPHDIAEPVLAQVPAMMNRLERIFSRFMPDSDLSQLNARPGEAVPVPPELFEVVECALAMAEETGGLFDPTLLDAMIAIGYERSFDELVVVSTADAPALQNVVPSHRAWRDIHMDPSQRTITLPPNVHLDLGGIAKGWSGQYVANALAEYGPCMVDAGGDLVTVGAPDELPGWSVGLADPGGSERDMLYLWLRDVSVATSGTDRRRWFRNGRMLHHLIDPHTGQPAVTDVITASVVAPDAVRAEAWAKASLLLGAIEGIGTLADKADLAGAILSEDGTLYFTSTMQRWSHIYASA